MTAFLESHNVSIISPYSNYPSGHRVIDIPSHHIIRYGTCADSRGWVGLHALEVAHQAPSRRCRHLLFLSPASASDISLGIAYFCSSSVRDEDGS